jgi:LysR family hydrogen peroxide-inducible transcriptional activator
LLPHVVPGLRARFPRLELLLIEEKTPTLERQLHDGKLDAAILALPVADEQLHAEFLFEEPFVLALPSGHRLAAADAVRLADLADQSLMLLEDGHCLRDQALAVCHRAGAGERDGFRATSLETLRQMVAADAGVTLLPILAVKPPVPRSDAIALRPFADAQPSRRIALVWRRSSALGGFLQRVAEVLRDLPPGLLSPQMTVRAQGPGAHVAAPKVRRSR